MLLICTSIKVFAMSMDNLQVGGWKMTKNELFDKCNVLVLMILILVSKIDLHRTTVQICIVGSN